MNPYGLLSHLGRRRRTSLQNPVTSGRPVAQQAFKTLSHQGILIQQFPSKPCHIWANDTSLSLQNSVTSGFRGPPRPSKPCHIWAERLEETFKTLSHLGCGGWDDLQNPVTSGSRCSYMPSKPCHIWVSESLSFLQNPVTSGRHPRSCPSKPCHIWGPLPARSFKTLSHLGATACAFLQNPVTSGRQVRPFGLQNPVTSGADGSSSPSKPCHIWVLIIMRSFKTLSHLGRSVLPNLQNPVTSGPIMDNLPSKPCHIWASRNHSSFKTLSHLGSFFGRGAFKTLSHLG